MSAEVAEAAAGAAARAASEAVVELRGLTVRYGRRSILDVLVSGDIAGFDNIVLTHPIEDITAAGRVSYNALGGAVVRQLMTDPCIALHVTALLAAARWRSDRLAASIGRLDAQARLCVLLLDTFTTGCGGRG